MSDIIERAARALLAKASNDAGAPLATDKEVNDFMPYMRAAIEAMRLPDERMIIAGLGAQLDRESGVGVWQAMIDQALKG